MFRNKFRTGYLNKTTGDYRKNKINMYILTNEQIDMIRKITLIQYDKNRINFEIN